MKISIRWALILGFLVLLWGTQITITSSTYLSSQQVLRGHARDIMRNIADLTMEQSEKHLSLAQGAAHLTKRLISSNVVGSEQSRQDLLERYFLDQLAIYPHFAGIYFGSANGDFFYVSRHDAQTPGRFRTKIIKHEDGRRTTRLIWRNAEQTLLHREEDPADTYDPRQRPWFIKASAAGDIVWTDPYIFYTSQKPGITIAGPVYRPKGVLQGIVGVDIEIDQLSEFVGKLRIGKNGRAFMLNNNGDVVAFPDVSKLKHGEAGQGNALRLVKIQELDDGLSRAAFAALDWQQTPEGRLVLQGAHFARFFHDGEPYHAEFTPFKNEQWPWIIGVYLPESDYLGSLKENRRFNMVLTLVLSAVVTLLGVWLAGHLTRPLAELEQAALAIKQHEWGPRPEIQSIFSEIQETSDSFARMQASLIDSEDKYRRIFENIQDVYYEASLDGILLELSPSVESVSGYKRGELLGTPIERLYADSGEREKFIEAIWGAGKVSNYEIAFYNKDAEIGYCSITAIIKKDEHGQPEKIVGSLHVITDKKKADMELQRYQSQLEELVKDRTRDLQATYQQLLAEVEKGKQKEAEKRKLEERFKQMERLEGIGTLAGGVAHDFNNLLMGIQGNVSLMLVGLDEAHPNYEKLRSIESCVSAGSELTRQLLGFARGGKYLVKPVNLNQVIQNTARMFGRTRKEISMVEKIDPDVWTVMADQGQIEQVLLNIYINAWQAMPDGGHIYVETRNKELDAGSAKNFDVEPGRYVRISVADTGVGMDEATQKRIFEPFFTTKEIGRGTGLGLASVYGIVTNHGGAVDFVSRLGQGTTFYLYLPACDVDVAETTPAAAAYPRGSETILLVDDEAVVLDVNKPMLEELGYKVLTARSGRAAVEIFEKEQAGIDMVVLDLIMPGMSGGEVFARIRAIRPDIKVLLSSGYSLSGESEELLERGCAGFIQKPFNLDQFASKIEEILRG